MAIDLAFGEQERLIQATAREFFEAHSPPAAVRACEREPESFDRDLWSRMADAGWLGMSFPDAYGGLDCGFLDLYAFYIELGRALAPVPHLETVGLAAPLIAALGDEAQKRRLLPAVAAGGGVLAVATHGPGEDDGALRAERAGGGYRLTGRKALVPYARAAAGILCTASAEGRNGRSLLLVDPQSPDLDIEFTPNIAGAPLYTLTFRGVTAGDDALLGEAGQAGPALDDALARAAVLQSAMVVGAGERLLDMSVDYARTRRQFGHPIGKYQAVQYLATDIALDLKSTRLLGLQAAWRIHSGRPGLREAALAKASASRSAARMTFAAHELHAGIGFMVDYDLQLYTRRAKLWEYNLGDARAHLERVMDDVAEDVADRDVLSAY
jgi:alkylation response protein AidB-like acyl-CoA dehydrogenase